MYAELGMNKHPIMRGNSQKYWIKNQYDNNLSWANQLRILSLQFDSIKATIGQGLINLFTPIIKTINIVIGKLAVVAKAFQAFTELITGKKASSGISEMSGNAEEGLENAAGAAESLTDGAAGAGKAAKKAAKEMKALMGFDEINKISEPSSNDDGNSGGSGGSTGASGVSDETMDFGNLVQGETVIDQTNQSLEKLIKRAKELAGLFKKGFSIGFGNSERNIKDIKLSLDSIKKSLVDIFTAKEVVNAADKLADAVALNLGKIVGSISGIAVSIVTNLTAGIAKSLEEKKSYIVEKLASLFKISGSIWNVTGDFIATLGDIISSALTSDSAINITSDIFSILITGILGGAELLGKAALDLSSFLTKPFIDNKEGIKEAIQNTLKPLADVIHTIKTAVEDAFSVANKTYEEHIAPMFEAMKEGCSDSFGKVLKAYNTYIAPVLKNLATKFQEVYEQHLKPCINKIGELIGSIADACKELYLVIFKPFVDWCIETIIPLLAPVFETIGKGILDAFGAIGDTIGGLLDIFDGVITFLVGVFTGDWKKVWKGIKKIFSGTVNWIKGVWSQITIFFSTILTSIQKVFEPIGKWFKQKFSDAWKQIKDVFSGIGNWFGKKATAVVVAFREIPRKLKQKFSDAWGNIKNVFRSIKEWFEKKAAAVVIAFHEIPKKLKEKFSDAWKNIKNVFSSIKEWFKTKATAVITAFHEIPKKLKKKFSDAWSNIKGIFSGIQEWFETKATAVVTAFREMPGNMESKFSDAWKKIKNVFSDVKGFFEDVWSTIKSCFTDIGQKIGDCIGTSFKNAINAVLNAAESLLNKPIDAINSLISQIPILNGIGKLKRFNLPRLAQGGYVKKNTPQLALIGDNRHQGEVVAPEDKLQEMAIQAAQTASGAGGNLEIVHLLKKLISLVEDGNDIVLMVDAQELARANQKGNLKLKRKFSTTKLIFE